MTLPDTQGTSKEGRSFPRVPTDVLLVAILALTAALAFALGMLAGRDLGRAEGREGVRFMESSLVPLDGGGPAAAAAAIPEESAPVPDASAAPTARVYVASKNGTKYYLPSCSTANRILEENRVWFGTKDEAAAAGYEPAANCPGL